MAMKGYALGMAERRYGVVQSLVLGFMLLVSGSIALYLLRTLTLHWIDMQD